MLYDKDIREPLFEFLEEKCGKIRIIEEKQMGRSRADVIMVMPSKLVGLEIKSDADTYARLKRQVKDYDKFYDKNYIVAGSKHIAHIDEHIPEYWGIISVELIGNKVDFLMVREAKDNPKVKLKSKIEILWRPELAHIQEINNMPKYKQKSKGFVKEQILQRVPENILNEQISEELFERDYNEIGKMIKEFKGK